MCKTGGRLSNGRIGPTASHLESHIRRNRVLWYMMNFPPFSQTKKRVAKLEPGADNGRGTEVNWVHTTSEWRWGNNKCHSTGCLAIVKRAAFLGTPNQEELHFFGHLEHSTNKKFGVTRSKDPTSQIYNHAYTSHTGASVTNAPISGEDLILCRIKDQRYSDGST